MSLEKYRLVSLTNGVIIFARNCMRDGVCVELELPGYLVINGWDQVIECKLVCVSSIVLLSFSGSGIRPSVVVG